MSVFYHPLYRWLTKCVRLVMLFVFKRRIIREMRQNDYLIDPITTTTTDLYRFWFVDCEWKDSDDCIHYLIEDGEHGVRQTTQTRYDDIVLH